MNKVKITAAILLCATAMFGQRIDKRPEGALRIMSYNVHNFVGMDGKRDYARVADVINRVAPDVVAIQEADSATQRSDGAYTLGEVAALVSMHPTYGPAIDFQGGKYGVGILSKEKPIKVRQFPLPGREERRTLLVVEFDRYIVACTHLSLNEDDRLASVEMINNVVRSIGKPLFLAGDMNSTPQSPPQRYMLETFKILNNVRKNTWSSTRPYSCIDYVYQFRNGHRSKALKRQVVKEKMASDHLPLFVDIMMESKKE